VITSEPCTGSNRKLFSIRFVDPLRVTRVIFKDRCEVKGDGRHVVTNEGLFPPKSWSFNES
jgi:hypothetical protein